MSSNKANKQKKQHREDTSESVEPDPKKVKSLEEDEELEVSFSDEAEVSFDPAGNTPGEIAHATAEMQHEAGAKKAVIVAEKEIVEVKIEGQQSPKLSTEPKIHDISSIVRYIVRVIGKGAIKQVTKRSIPPRTLQVFSVNGVNADKEYCEISAWGDDAVKFLKFFR
jgi:hypothetical protein